MRFSSRVEGNCSQHFLSDFLNRTFKFFSMEKVKMQIKKVKKMYTDGAGSIVYGRETSCLIHT